MGSHIPRTVLDVQRRQRRICGGLPLQLARMPWPWVSCSSLGRSPKLGLYLQCDSEMASNLLMVLGGVGQRWVLLPLALRLAGEYTTLPVALFLLVTACSSVPLAFIHSSAVTDNVFNHRAMDLPLSGVASSVWHTKVAASAFESIPRIYLRWSLLRHFTGCGYRCCSPPSTGPTSIPVSSSPLRLSL